MLEPLAPLVKEGYRELAVRAMNGVNAWHASLSHESRKGIEERLSPIILQEQKSAPVIYVSTGGKVERRVASNSGSLLEDSVSSAVKELCALSDNGDASGVNPASFNRLFFALGYSVFEGQVPDAVTALKMACNIAAAYYEAEGAQGFVDQLKSVARLGGIKIEPFLQGIDYTSDGRLAALTFIVSDSSPVVVNFVTSLRLLYLAANVDPAKQGYDLAWLRERLVSVTKEKGVASEIPEAYWQDDSNVQAIDRLLTTVSLHKGVEAVLLECRQLNSNLRDVLRLGKILDTVKTGKVAIDDSDKNYSDAIGIAELID